MTLFQALILGVVEGLTEFLPISSTFHLLFTAKLLGIAQTEFTKLFAVLIQTGAILAVLTLYLKEVFYNRRLMTLVAASFIPTALFGFLLYKVIKGVFFESTAFMLWVFVVVGVVFFALEWLVKNGKVKPVKTLPALTVKDALVVGLMQALAVVPGVSRAGSVLIGLMVLGFKREEGAKYSFLLALPTIMAAGAFDLLESYRFVSWSGQEISLIAVGLIASFITAYLSVTWFVGYVSRHSLVVFGVYRIVIGIALMSLFYGGVIR